MSQSLLSMDAEIDQQYATTGNATPIQMKIAGSVLEVWGWMMIEGAADDDPDTELSTDKSEVKQE